MRGIQFDSKTLVCALASRGNVLRAVDACGGWRLLGGDKPDIANAADEQILQCADVQ